jgi:GNAT superfamily N-acetyltransferase
MSRPRRDALARDPLRHSPRGCLFDRQYREPLRLEDGTTGTIRLIRAEDKELLRRGFARLSDDARYNRFFVRKPALLESELRYLTEVDHCDHFAIVAVAAENDPDAGLAVARAVRLLREPWCFEAAVTVVDAYQRLGLGTLLLRRLVAAVVERGGGRLCFWVLPSNGAMLRLLRRVAPEASLQREDDLLRCDLLLPAPAESTLFVT